MSVLYTLYELLLTLFILVPKELLIRWATDVYVFDEGQIAGTVQLVTDSIFEMVNVSIQGFPRQIPDGDPNRIDSLVVPGPSFPGTHVNEVKQPSLCTFHIRHLVCSLQMYTHFCYYAPIILFI